MDVYLHIRVLLSMILGLGVGHLLRGVSRIVQHPTKIRVYWVHLVWVLFVFLYLIHFWWWEFYLQKIPQWTFPLYFFLALYATLLFLLCSLFFPDEMSEYDGYRDYYYSRKRWIFSLMIILFAADTLDNFIKGSDYFARLGVFYEIRIGSYILFCLLAIWAKSPRFHAFFAIFALITEVLNILKRYLTIH
ncbi:hypothetical protein H7849_20135 [Alloacidobacterium dinghuense]|uniref:Uncharacterized protein n=1 Tax=Alloacidobacterium dinghuense TaxID=2763107 RepID=A0A7G8BFP6_9BACT|nr:hypothetical protein [Alloacidobacterium dinghuense]QNI31366.1 hypothetical protein H7849_20135 [Alloacidobacterium dinghuense]